jgi:hypothetical protein
MMVRIQTQVRPGGKPIELGSKFDGFKLKFLDIIPASISIGARGPRHDGFTSLLAVSPYPYQRLYF